MTKKLVWCMTLSALAGLLASGSSSLNKKSNRVLAESETHDHSNYTNWGDDESEKTSLPHKVGSYYLSSDITIPSTWILPVGQVDLCLNGHVIKVIQQSNRLININSTSVLNLYDCGSTVHNGYVDTNGLWHLDEEGSNELEEGEVAKSIIGGIITGGEAANGGAIYNEGTFNMYGGTIAGCIAHNADFSQGGGVCNTNTFVMYGGAITNCTADSNGGAIYNEGTFTMNGGSISECRVFSGVKQKGLGGGLYNYTGGITTLSGGTIENNKASRHGGGIQNCGSATLKITGGSIINNEATGNGGGGINSDGEILMSGGIISNNKANISAKGGGIRYNNNSVNKNPIIVGGTAKIIDNTAGNFRSNLYLCEYNLLNVGTKTQGVEGNGVDKPTDEMFIGVSPYYGISKFATNSVEDDKKYFFADSYENLVAYNSSGYLETIRATTNLILPEDFPTKIGDGIPENAWINEKGAKLYLDNGVFYVDDKFYVPSSSSELQVAYNSTEGYLYGSEFVVGGTLYLIFNQSKGPFGPVDSITTKSDPSFESNIFGTYKPLATIAKPTADSTSYVYNGTAQTYTLEANEAYTVSGNTKTEAGTYTVTVTLINTYQYKWSDGTTDPLTYTFVINNKAEDVKVKEGGVEIDPSNAKVSIIDAENGIDPNAVFVVEVVEMNQSSDVQQSKQALENNNKIGENEKIFGIYDAKLLIDGAEVQPNGTITIKMLVPEEIRNANFKLYHIHNGSEVSDMEYTQIDESGFITFTTDKLSQFAFVSEVAPEHTDLGAEATGLGAGAIVGIVLGSLVLLVLIAYVLGYFFFYREGKLDDKKIKVIYSFLPRGEKNLKQETK